MPFPLIPLVTLAAGAVSAGMKAKTAKDQMSQAEQIRSGNPRPTYSTPKPILQNNNIAQMMALQGLPGQQLMLDRLRGSTAAGTRAVTDLAQDPATKAAMAAGLYSQELGAVNDLNIADANFRVAGQERLMRSNEILASYKDKEFDYNMAQPYDNAMAAASALTGAGMQNKNAAMEDILSGVTGATMGFANSMANNQVAQSLNAQADGARKAATLGMPAGVASLLGGAGQAPAPTQEDAATMPTGNEIDITGLTDEQITIMPEFIEFSKAYPYASPAELVEKFKVQFGWR